MTPKPSRHAQASEWQAWTDPRPGAPAPTTLPRLSGKPLRATGIAWAWEPFRPVQKLGCCRLNKSASKLRDDGISKQLLNFRM